MGEEIGQNLGENDEVDQRVTLCFTDSMSDLLHYSWGTLGLLEVMQVFLESLPNSQCRGEREVLTDESTENLRDDGSAMLPSTARNSGFYSSFCQQPHM